MINYNDKKFVSIQNTVNGETSAETIFNYRQDGDILTAVYAGGKIIKGHLIGLVAHDGKISMRYHQVNDKMEMMTGTCESVPEILHDGRIRLHETWQWTSGDCSNGQSIIEEIR